MPMGRQVMFCLNNSVDVQANLGMIHKRESCR